MVQPSGSIDSPGPTRVVDPDQRIVMHGIDWAQFETLLAIRGDRAGVRMAYLKGDLELMRPSRSHESLKTLIGRLFEAYADEKGLVLEGYGSMTMRSPLAERGIEPDECYAIGAPKESPDLAVEVIWTRGGIDKLEVYRGLGVREVWIWRNGNIEVHSLRGERYAMIARSELLPDLDPALLARLCESDTQTSAVRALREALRTG